MLKTEKERVVAELVERLRASETLIVADYRGLDMTAIDDVRTELLKHGARFSVVKNTLTKRAAEEAGVSDLVAFLDGPTAIAFVGDGDMVAVAKALSDAARETKILAAQGRDAGRRADDGRPGPATSRRCRRPTCSVARCSAAIVAPLTAIVGLVNAPLQNLARPGRRTDRAAPRAGRHVGRRGARSPPRNRARRGAPSTAEEPAAEAAAEEAPETPPRKRATEAEKRPAEDTSRRPTSADRRRDNRRDDQERRSSDGCNRNRQGVRRAREDERSRTRRAEEQDRGGVGHHRRRSGRGRGARRRRLPAPTDGAAEEQSRVRRHPHRRRATRRSR